MLWNRAARADMRYPDEGPWHQEVHEYGLNYRLPDVLAALGLSQLKRLESFKARRAAIFARYQEGLAGVDGIRLPTRRDYVDPIWHLYPLRVLDGRRREVFERLRAEASASRSTTSRSTGTRFSRTSATVGGCAPTPRVLPEEISLPLLAELTVAERTGSSTRSAAPSGS